jgi:hypothetical protein
MSGRSVKCRIAIQDTLYCQYCVVNMTVDTDITEKFVPGKGVVVHLKKCFLYIRTLDS